MATIAQLVATHELLSGRSRGTSGSSGNVTTPVPATRRANPNPRARTTLRADNTNSPMSAAKKTALTPDSAASAGFCIRPLSYTVHAYGVRGPNRLSAPYPPTAAAASPNRTAAVTTDAGSDRSADAPDLLRVASDIRSLPPSTPRPPGVRAREP